MHGDVIGFVAFDFILRFVWTGVAGVALVIRVSSMDLSDRAADVAGFRIPRNVIADFKTFAHLRTSIPLSATVCPTFTQNLSLEDRIADMVGEDGLRPARVDR